MRQKIFTLLFALVATTSSLFAESGTCGENLTWDLTNGILTISGSGNMTNFSGSDSPWYSKRETITNVLIQDGVTSIGEHAFYYCNNLTSVTIPSSVTSIGEAAFIDCSGLTSVTIPNGVTSISKNTFCNCTRLAFVTIPNNLTSIGEHAFSYCDALTSFTIPNTVISIGEGAFYQCIGLTSITIPNSVTSIGWRAFGECSGLTSITVESGNTTYDSRNNCNAIIETATNTLIKGCENTIIPNSVTSIEQVAFCACTGLTSIKIPNSVTCIGRMAFANCRGLTSFTIPSSVTSIDEYAFSKCTSLTSVYNYASTPHNIYNAFDKVNVSACTLYVPVESVNAYKAAKEWKDFGNIIGIVPEGIDEIKPSVVYKTSHKVLCEGQVRILQGEKTYTVTGQEVQ